MPYCTSKCFSFASFQASNLAFRRNPPDVFLRKNVLKISSKFTGERQCQSATSIINKVCSPLNLLHIFRTSFPRNTSWWLLLGFLDVTFFCTQNLIIALFEISLIYVTFSHSDLLETVLLPMQQQLP